MKRFIAAAGVCLVVASLASAQTTNWLAFNDHRPGPGTAPNVTGYDMRLTGNGGPLTDYIAGSPLSATLSVVNVGTAAPDDFGGNNYPNAGTPAYNLFNGIADVGNAGIVGIRSGNGVSVTLTFSGLDPSKSYVFRGTSVRGNSYPSRWSVYTITDAVSSVAAHVDGSPDLNIFTLATFPSGTLTASQVALNSGENRVGSIVGWDDIRPSASGTFSIIAEQYRGPTPFGTASDTTAAPYGYGLTAIMLAEVSTGPPEAPVITTQPGNVTVGERQVASLQAIATGTGPLTYQWYKGTPPSGVLVAGATGPNLRATNIAGSGKAWSVPADSGQYYVVVTGAVAPPATSTPATVTVTPDTTAPTFLFAQCGTAAEDIIVGLSEPLELDNGEGTSVGDAFTWLVQKITGPGGDPGQPSSVTYVEGATTVLLTVNAGTIDPLATYKVVLVEYMRDRAIAENKLPANSSVVIECPQAISVLPSGAGPFTFDRAPYAKQFATFSWAGAANTGDTPVTFDAKVQLLDATSITTPLAAAAGSPPAAAGAAQWASVGQYLITRPTGVEGCAILAHLRNDSGQTRTALGISYNLTVEAPVTEEVLGHLVYYSLSGTPSSWQQIPGISNDRTTGLKSANLDLSATPWTVGSPLYILWADDNGSGSPDDANEIDNFAVSLPASGPTLSISYSSPNITITWTPASGVLQFKDDIMGVWADVTPQPAAGGPYNVAASAAHRFYSLRQ